MTERIHIMDESLSSKIAAGEVVERPASIVKELVENALDAGATKITIALEDGGKSSITITDNGSGIEAEDVPLTVHRHATSKLHNEAELEAISTMGFRGEALYSIAAVSKFSLKSKTEGAVGGKKVSVSGGGVAKITDDPCNVGTTVEVKELFFNTPARQKFLRGAQTEFTRIMELIRKMAIARPDVRFTLKHGKRSSFDVPEAELKKRLGDIFGDDVTGELLEVKGNPGWDVSVTGYVSTAGRGQATAKNVMTFLNGRIIKDKAINRAIIDGYQGMIDQGRYPFAVIMIEMNAGEVDVNVHPAKTEVRFAKPSAIFNAVKGSVTNALRGGNGAKSIRYTEARRPFGNATEVKAAEETTRVPFKPSPFKPSAPPRTAFGGDKVMPSDLKAEQREISEEVVSDDIREPLFLSMDVVGQLFGEFLVTTRGTEFFLIDQHAAAERVRYEKLKELYKGNAGGAESMLLLMPQSFTLSGE
ncbi:MAG: DNA mismatch repair endonuclease MutL, partial [Deltaproteobacteria bacterium]|nr:DNA mismatch repair endonuclease MutL [Deltaproteobacteria bacterium]